MRRIILVVAGLTATALGLATARSDQPVRPEAPPGGVAVATGCLGDLAELRGRIERDGFAVAGWGGDQPGYAIGPEGLAGTPAIDPGRGDGTAATDRVTERSDGPWAAV